MYSFTFGTYDGLFVECDTPAVLPNDLSYFDLRRSERRAIPADNTPNVLIRKIQSDIFENAGDIILIALVYKALEGSREGFIGFGCILVDDISQAKVTEALRKSIALANQSGDFFSKGRLLNRPRKTSTTPIDLRQLPLSGTVSCFGQVRTSLTEQGTILDIGELTEILFQKLSSFELVMNENHGLEISEIGDFLEDQENKQKVIRHQKELQKAKLENEEKLARFAKKERQNRILINSVYGVSATAFIGLVVLIIIWLVRPDNFVPRDKELVAEKQEVSNQLKKSNTKVSLEDTEQKPSKGKPTGCLYDEAEPDLSNWAFMSVDLSNKLFSEKSEKCFNLATSAFTLLKNNKFNKPALKRVFQASKDEYLRNKELFEGEYRLTSFQRFLDDILQTERDSIFLGVNTKEKSELASNYTFAFSVDYVAPERMSCSDGASDPKKDDFKLYYFTESNGVFETIVQTLSKSYKDELRKSFRDLSKNTAPELSIVRGKFAPFISNFRKSKVERYKPETSMSESFCVLTFSKEDAEALDQLETWTRGNSIAETFKLLGRVNRLISEAQKEGHYTYMPKRYPNCKSISLPQYVIIFHTETPGKAIKKIVNFSFDRHVEENNANFEGFRDRFPPFRIPLGSEMITKLNDITEAHGQKLVDSFQGKEDAFCAQK